jgi:hypothetical protein
LNKVEITSSLNHLLNQDAPKELFDSVTACTSEDDLVKMLEKNTYQLLTIFQHMKIDSNEPLVARLLTRINPNGLDNTDE